MSVLLHDTRPLVVSANLVTSNDTTKIIHRKRRFPGDHEEQGSFSPAQDTRVEAKGSG